MKLKKVEILKYKSFGNSQKFEIEEDITILVGMNESGKTSALEAIAKTNYFQDDASFKFNVTHDYPRRQRKKMGKSGIIPGAIVCTYEIDNNLINEIESELGKDTLESTEFGITTEYDNKNIWSPLKINKKKVIENITSKLGISSKAVNRGVKTIKR